MALQDLLAIKGFVKTELLKFAFQDCAVTVILDVLICKVDLIGDSGHFSNNSLVALAHSFTRSVELGELHLIVYFQLLSLSLCKLFLLLIARAV